MKKRITASVFIFMLLISILIQAAAAVGTVVDEAGYLTAEEVVRVSSRLEAIRNAINIDVSLAVVKSTDGKDIQDFADDYYDYLGYGMGDDDSGILLVVSQSPRAYHFTTHARGEQVFNQRNISILKNEIEPYLRQNRYYDAFIKYSDTVKKILDPAQAVSKSVQNNNTYSSDYASANDGYRRRPEDSAGIFMAIWVLSLAMAGVVTYRVYANTKKVAKQTRADAYLNEGSFKLEKNLDIYLYSVETRSRKPEENTDNTSSGSHGGGGSGGSHVSSSGRSHGGGGGSY